MANDWIKMRGALTEHPKVIAVARALSNNKSFRDWLTPGGSGQINGQIVSDDALRCVTCALLMRMWSRAREHGKFVGDNLILRHNSIADLDQMAGAPGIGNAVELVGWATPKNGVTLRNFKEYNVPMTPAEKQKLYRERHRFSALPARDTGVTPRGEKRRVNKKENKQRKKAFQKPTLDDVAAYCSERQNGIDPQAFIDHYEAAGWKRGKTPISDWKACVRTWEANQRQKSAGPRLLTDAEKAEWSPV